eukprot:NODE_683_length_1712_cov_71.218297_g673_i0.p1 GENE.NODE_683_length_1712_cov_71.218297_g673_i0~~NODE_683_length_1712_cov_71.218297_g673_i0.p1  ORF type:complete len:282 (-),score=68.37 NODE_683_length_1712_cov_71.218297_g673_i0:867-1637(-)
MVEKCKIYEEGKDVYQATLNQTNVGSNNNKFYIIQLFESNAGGQYWVWNRWARVGDVGQSKLEPCGSNLAKAKSAFTKKFSDKTKNKWENRAKFVKYDGKYQYMEMDYGDDADDGEDDAPAKQAKFPDSKLDNRILKLVTLISDTKMMTNMMAELKIDTRKMPLGKIAKSQIRDAYDVLKQLDKLITNGAGRGPQVTKLCSNFYTLIPHDFGRSVPPLITDHPTVQKKMEMLDALADLEIASKLLQVYLRSNSLGV